MSTDTVEDLSRKRFALLHALYEASGGRRNVIVQLQELAEGIGFSSKEADPLAEWLEGEYLIEYKTFGPGVALTHEGIKQVEKALSSPDERTDYFPPINVIYVGSMLHSQIQQGAVSSVQRLSASQMGLDQLKEVIQEARASLSDLELDEEQEATMSADLTTLEAQASSPNPKPSIIRESLASVRSILEAAAGQAAAAALLHLLSGIN